MANGGEFAIDHGNAESKLGELVAVRDTIELSGGAVSWPVGCVGRCLVAVGPMTKSSVLSVSLRELGSRRRRRRVFCITIPTKTSATTILPPR